MGVNSLPKTVTRQRRDCDLNPGPSAPESSTLTTWLPSHPVCAKATEIGGTKGVYLVTQQGQHRFDTAANTILARPQSAPRCGHGYLSGVGVEPATKIGKLVQNYPNFTFLQLFGSKMGPFNSLSKSAKSIQFWSKVIYGSIWTLDASSYPDYSLK